MGKMEVVATKKNWNWRKLPFPWVEDHHDLSLKHNFWGLVILHRQAVLSLLQVCGKLVGNDFQFDVTVHWGRLDLDLILNYQIFEESIFSPFEFTIFVKVFQVCLIKIWRLCRRTCSWEMKKQWRLGLWIKSYYKNLTKIFYKSLILKFEQTGGQNWFSWGFPIHYQLPLPRHLGKVLISESLCRNSFE